VQEALTRAFARRGTFRGSGTVEAWLWKAVVNSARNVRARSPLDLDYAAIAAALGIRRANAECLRRRAAAAAQAAGWADALWHAPLPRRLRSPRETAHALRVRQSRGQAQRVAGRLGRDEAVGQPQPSARSPSRRPASRSACSTALRWARSTGRPTPRDHASSASAETPSIFARSVASGTRAHNSANKARTCASAPARPEACPGSRCGYGFPAACIKACVLCALLFLDGMQRA